MIQNVEKGAIKIQKVAEEKEKLLKISIASMKIQTKEKKNLEALLERELEIITKFGMKLGMGEGQIELLII